MINWFGLALCVASLVYVGVMVVRFRWDEVKRRNQFGLLQYSSFQDYLRFWRDRIIVMVIWFMMFIMGFYLFTQGGRL